MRYRFTRSWARVLVAVGFVIVAVGVAVSIAALVVPPTDMERQLSPADAVTARIAGGVLGIVVGVLVGGPVIVAGQVLLVLLEQRALLAQQSRSLRRIQRRLNGWERVRRGKPEATPADRLLRRP